MGAVIPAPSKLAATSDGGFVFGTARDTGGGTAGSGVTLRKVDASGALQWRSFASPGPGIHGMIGVRELSDGRFLAAISNDAADSRNVPSGSALLTFTFDASGQLESSQSVRFTLTEGTVPCSRAALSRWRPAATRPSSA